MYLITGAAGFSGVVSDLVVELLRGNGEQVRAMVRLRDEARAKRLCELGAEVVVGDPSSPANVVDAMRDVTRMFFNTYITLDYLQETAIVCAAARELGGLKVIVHMSQMTVSQMTLTSSEESRQHRLLWLSELIMNWSGIPVIHVRRNGVAGQPAVHGAGPAIRARSRRAGFAVRRRAHLPDRCRGRGARGRCPAAEPPEGWGGL